MFGYVRPLKGDLRVREFEEFRAVYCGLCHALRRRCGFRARFIVNYDFVFLAMLLSEKERAEFEFRRCVASPLRKKCLAVNDPAIDLAADYSVILTYWKLRDGVRDGGFFESMAARLLSLLLRRAYKKAVRRNPEFDAVTRLNLDGLGELEREGCPSLDRAADRFALILAAASDSAAGEARRRALYQALYHVGRAVYIMDAADDYGDDLKKGAYNALIYRFGGAEQGLGEAEREELRITVSHSVNLILSAVALLDENAYIEVLDNIVCLGIPFIMDKILAGEWRVGRGEAGKASARAADE